MLKGRKGWSLGARKLEIRNRGVCRRCMEAIVRKIAGGVSSRRKGKSKNGEKWGKKKKEEFQEKSGEINATDSMTLLRIKYRNYRIMK